MSRSISKVVLRTARVFSIPPCEKTVSIDISSDGLSVATKSYATSITPGELGMLYASEKTLLPTFRYNVIHADALRDVPVSVIEVSPTTVIINGTPVDTVKTPMWG